MSPRSWSPFCAHSLLILMLSACIFSGPRRLLAQPSDTLSQSGSSTECKSLSIQFAAAKSPVLEGVMEILASRIQERSGMKPTLNGQADCRVELDVRQGIGTQGFRIEQVSRGEVRIVGNDERGLLCGVGKFLRSNTYRQGSFILGKWRGTSVPEKPFRGIYLATHFFNFYHQAPIEKVERYVEDLGLWGYNTVFVWFDMFHFEGMQDPAAQAMVQRLNDILRTAKNLGLRTGLVLVANEAYVNSPVALRADWTAGHDGYRHDLYSMHIELCPNKPGAKELLLKWRDEAFRAFKDVGIDDVVIWPYDNGGCTCSLCKPWGANGFLTIAEPTAELARREFPGCQIILSTWYFDKFTSGEWDGLERKFGKERPKWVDYLMADDAGVQRYSGRPPGHHVPGGFPLLSFPEISMEGADPWGGFGANPLPAYHQKLWNVGKDSLAGGFPYSEGLFEDLNKVLFAQFFWQEDAPAASVVDEYIAYEFSPEVVPLVRRAIELLEKNYRRRGENLRNARGPVRFVLEQSSGAEEAFNLIRQVDTQLSPQARDSWRWRILYLRALIDSELVKNDFRVSSRCEEAMQELTKIYYAQRALFLVSPPTKEAIKRFRERGK